MLHTVYARILAVIASIAAWRLYPLLIGAIAVAVTLSMLLPFVPILIGAVLARRERWAALGLMASLGSALGGVGLYLVFHHLGWSRVIEAYPELLQSQAWADVTRWVSAYGVWALFAIAAAPVAQAPAIILAAVSSLPIDGVFLALFAGRLIKFGVYAWLASRFPAWFRNMVARVS